MKKIQKGIAIFWTLFIGVGAVAGAIMMFIDPTGASTKMDGLLPGLKKLPFADTLFQDLLFSGFALLIVNGLTQLCAFYKIMKNSPRAPQYVMACGIILMLWITIQFFIFDFNALSTAYCAFGVMETASGIIWHSSWKR